MKTLTQPERVLGLAGTDFSPVAGPGRIWVRPITTHVYQYNFTEDLMRFSSHCVMCLVRVYYRPWCVVGASLGSNEAICSMMRFI